MGPNERKIANSLIGEDPTNTDEVESCAFKYVKICVHC